MLDWLMREGGAVFAWWALVALAGAAAMPLLWRVLHGLPDRGYAFARAAGMLLVAFVFWLLASLGFLRNSTESMALAWVIVLVLGLAALLSGPRPDLRAYWRENRAAIVATELLFAGLFILWAVVRAHQNGLSATEKPMELAFISATMRSEFLPPNDPWLAGYSISYYYFGYLMAAMLANLSRVPSTMAFNLMIALLFALTGVTVFGVGYNLVRANALARLRTWAYAVGSAPDMLPQPGRRAAVLTGLLAVLLVVVVGNFQAPLIEVPYEYGASSDYLQFFGSNERLEQRTVTATDLGSWEYWWFFRGARVLNDLNLDGGRSEVIDEFPQFSFLLADVHPHVLALPFAALAIGLALHVLLAGRAPNALETVFYSTVIGGLIFLNTWDGPIYLAVLVGAEGLRRLIANGRGRLGWGDLLWLAGYAVAVVGLAVLFYLPFLISFRSQLGGILPNFVHPTWFPQFFVAFGPLLLLLAGFLLVEAWRGGRRMNWRAGLLMATGVLGLLIGVLAVFALVAALQPTLAGSALEFVDANGGVEVVLPALVQKRLTHGLTSLVLLAGLVLIVARLFPRKRGPNPEEVNGRLITFSPSTGFALLLAAAGLVLTLVPEFVYLRDNFGTRMNTVFKFYYQAWLLWGVAAAYGVYNVFAEARARQVHVAGRAAFGAVTVATLALGLVYPVAGVYWRTQVETGRAGGSDAPLTLDGIASVAWADDLAVIQCLSTLAQGSDVVAERVGGSYDVTNPPSGLAGRVAGLPNVLNWTGHQGQWRGTTYNATVGSRDQDLDILFASTDWAAVQEIIDRYGIDYIVFGTAERDKYGGDAELKFRDRLALVCESGGSRVYGI